MSHKFKLAANFKLQFGPFEGKTIDQIAKTNKGLSYLDNLNGKIQNRHSPVANAITTYLEDPTIAKDLKEMVEEQNEKFNSR